MFVTANQFYVFLACVGFGGVSGVLFTLSLPFKLLLKQKWVEWIIDFIIFFIIGLLFILYSLRLKFPSLSTYMIFAVFVGITAYMKSFHIMLAKIIKMGYNSIRLKLRKFTDDRRKKQENKNCNDSGCSIATRNSPRGNDISVDSDRC